VAVVGITADQISARANFFRIAIQKQIESPILTGLSPVFHPRAPEVLVEMYFCISQAYKSVYMDPGRRTDDSKKAAFSCAAICALKPIRCEASEIEKEEFIYINEMLAMRVACAIVEHPFHTRHFDEVRRFYRALQDFSLPSLRGFMQEVRSGDGQIVSEHSISLSVSDRSALNLLINMFSVLKDMRVYNS
jgi:hypothetical protein